MLVKYSRMHVKMAKLRHAYATDEAQKKRLKVARDIAYTEQEMAALYVTRVMSERHQQKKKELYDGDANSTIFVAKRFSTISHKREDRLETLKIECEMLFGKPQ